MKTSKRIKVVTHAAIIAALYVVLTYLTNLIGLANGPIQCRLSEALCILPAFTPAAVPGLFVGCILSNVFAVSTVQIFDVIFGSLATLIGAVGTQLLAKYKAPCWLYPVPTVVSNTLIVPFVLKYAYGFPGGLWYFFITVGAGEIISCGIFGTVLYLSLRKHSARIFK